MASIGEYGNEWSHRPGAEPRTPARYLASISSRPMAPDVYARSIVLDVPTMAIAPPWLIRRKTSGSAGLLCVTNPMTFSHGIPILPKRATASPFAQSSAVSSVGIRYSVTLPFGSFSLSRLSSSYE